eukprot:9485023-Pyramimonas_sp.AAC.1
MPRHIDDNGLSGYENQSRRRSLSVSKGDCAAEWARLTGAGVAEMASHYSRVVRTSAPPFFLRPPAPPWFPWKRPLRGLAVDPSPRDCHSGPGDSRAAQKGSKEPESARTRWRATGGTYLAHPRAVGSVERLDLSFHGAQQALPQHGDGRRGSSAVSER